MNKTYKLAIVGATGLVGRTALKVLEEKNLPISNYVFFASSNSAGKEIVFQNKKYIVRELNEHSFDDGFELDIEEVKKDIDELVGQDGVTFSGGDPFYQVEACLELAKYIKSKKLNIWCYTGFTYESLMSLSNKNPKIKEFIKTIDVLIDGPFLLEQKSLDCTFRGSKNQRIIDTKESLKQKKVCLVEKYYQEKKKNNNKRGLYV